MRIACVWPLFVASGCSVVFMRPTPRFDEATRTLECPATPLVVDAIAAGVAGYVGLLASACYPGSEGQFSCSWAGDIRTPALVAAGTLAASMVWGIAMNRACLRKLDDARKQQAPVDAVDEATRAPTAAPAPQEEQSAEPFWLRRRR